MFPRHYRLDIAAAVLSVLLLYPWIAFAGEEDAVSPAKGHDNAEVHYRQAFEKARKMQDADAQVEALEHMARAHFVRQRHEESLKILEQALEIRKSQTQAEDAGFWRTYYLMALNYRWMTKIKKTIELNNKALAVLDGNGKGDSLEALITIDNILELADPLSKRSNYEEYFERRDRLVEKFMDVENLSVKGVDDTFFETRDPLLEMELTPKRVFGIFGDNLYMNSYFAESEKFYRRSLADAEKRRLVQSNTLSRLAEAIDAQGRHEEARELLDRALMLKKKEPLLVPIHHIAIYNIAAFHYFFSGDHEKAAKYLVTAIESRKDEVLDAIEIPYVKACYYQGIFSKFREKPDYVSEGDGKNFRWNTKSRDILVYIETPEDEPLWREVYAGYVEDAFTKWSNALEKPLTFKFTRDSKEYDVKVSWTRKAKEEAKLGPSVWWAERPEERQVVGANFHVAGSYFIVNDLAIALRYRNGKPVSERMIHSHILHEVGHVMGIKKHSDSPTDVMAANSVAGFEKLDLSPRDIATIREIYSRKADVQNDRHRRVSQIRKQYGFLPVRTRL